MVSIEATPGEMFLPPPANPALTWGAMLPSDIFRSQAMTSLLTETGVPLVVLPKKVQFS